MNIFRTVRVLVVLVVFGFTGVFGNKLAWAQCSINPLPCGPGDPTTSQCNLSFSGVILGIPTCRSYRSALSGACVLADPTSPIGNLSFTLPGESSDTTWVCFAAVNVRITQGAIAGNWSFTETTTDTPPSAPPAEEGSFGGSFGTLSIAAGASDFRQVSGVAWGPQLGPFHGGDVVTLQVNGGDTQRDTSTIWDRVNINAMCCQGM